MSHRTFRRLLTSYYIVLPECSTKFVVVHVRLVFSHPPQLGHLVGIYEAKLSAPILLPTNDLRVLLGVGQ